MIVETWKQNKRDVEATARYHAITVPDAQAALAYYADFPEEIDEIIERKRKFAERYERVFVGPTRAR